MPIEPIADGLVIPEVGAWAKRKYHYLGRYLEAFTTAMRSKWREMHYVDLFAGPGFASIRHTNELVLGSPLIAAGLKHPFSCMHLCDQDKNNCDAIRARIAVHAPNQQVRVLCNDANKVIDELLHPIPRRNALCMTFIDPFGLHLELDTIKAIAELRSDLIVLLADNMDALRNWAKYYYNNPNSNLDRLLGEPGWRDEFVKSPSSRLAERLRSRFVQRLREMGYAHFASLSVQNSMDRDIYSLVYATRSEAGIKIWNGISSIDQAGQRNLPFAE